MSALYESSQLKEVKLKVLWMEVLSGHSEIFIKNENALYWTTLSI